MVKRLKEYLVYALIIGVGYFFLSRHIVFHGRDFYLLPKDELTMEYTLYSIKEKKPDVVLKIAPLRNAGIGGILVERGTITEEERYDLEATLAYEADEEE